MKSYQQFFAELKRRHVFKVAAIYGVTAFVLLQVADLLIQGLKLSPDFLSMITVLVLLGFPVTLIIAWAFELTPKGVRRTDAASREELAEIVSQPASKRWTAGLMALAGVAALVFGAWWVGRQGAPGVDEARGEIDGADASRGASPRLAYTDIRGDARPSIAVLPFADMSREGDQEYFSDGITEEILNTLANVRELRVSGRTSAFAYKGADKDLREIGKELGVRYIVEGSVRKEGDQLRITAQLIDADDGSHLWSDQYDRTLESVFAIQSEIAAAIAEELRVPLGLAEAAGLVQPVGDFDAYDLYLAARARMRERGAALNEAVRLYEAAIGLDSAWAPAWAGLAEAREIRLWYREPWGGNVPDAATIAGELAGAEAAARRALALDPRQASAHVALGNVLRDNYQWREAEAQYREALAIDPDNAEAHHQYAELLNGMGRIAEAVRAAERAALLDPAPVRFNVLGSVLDSDDRPEEALQAFERGIALDPTVSLPALRGNAGGVHYNRGEYERAMEYWTAITPDFSEADARDYREWTGWLRQGTLAAIPDSARRYLSPEDWMTVGEADSAAVALAKGEEQGLEFNGFYRFWDPIFDPIRSHPRVQSFLRERNLGGAKIQRTRPEDRQPLTVLRAVEAEEAE